MLQKRGIPAGVSSEEWNLTHPEIITEIHKEYLAAGAGIITSNTFGASPLKYEDFEKYAAAAMECAKNAMEGYDGYIAFDIGPTGKLIKPMGTLDFEDAVEIFRKEASLAEKYGADLILIETMNDAYETKAAVLGAKEGSVLPVFVTNAYDERGKLMTGADPVAMTALLEGLGADVIGMNCSVGPDLMVPVVKKMAEYTSLPILVSPNAGLPEVEDGETVYNVDADGFADTMLEIAKAGGCILGGCCGTTPEYIRKTKEKILEAEARGELSHELPERKNHTLISSYSHALEIGKKSLLIGERINPTGKKRIKEALKNENYGLILNEAFSQEEKGVHVLDVNAGLPGIDEPEVLKKLVSDLQSVSDTPLQIDSSNPEALEKAMRIYNGKPLVNSVTGAEESMDAVFPLLKKYGGVVIGLTMDESGIPDTAEGRTAIAEKIIRRAAEYGIDKKDIVIDPLTMTVSSDGESANVTIEAIRMIRERLGVYTSLGVSNISFGLPKRNLINQAFYTLALNAGLDLAIMNPDSEEMMNAYHAFHAVRGLDEGCLEYIGYAEGKQAAPAVETSAEITLQQAILKGMKEQAEMLSEKMLEEAEPLDIIDGHLVPALNQAGELFESRKMFLPQLIMTADAASGAFEVLKKKMPEKQDAEKRIVLATVKGDIHDIGKNIVKALLESYGYSVDDLGKDVAPERIAEAAEGCRLVGLSALMTTTVPAMEETIRLLKAAYEDIQIVVGGAVLTQDYADEIGADYYGKDAMDTVRVAQKVLG